MPSSSTQDTENEQRENSASSLGIRDAFHSIAFMHFGGAKETFKEKTSDLHAY